MTVLQKAHSGLRIQTRCTDLSKENQRRFPLGNDVRGADLPSEGSAGASLQRGTHPTVQLPRKMQQIQDTEHKECTFHMSQGSVQLYEDVILEL